MCYELTTKAMSLCMHTAGRPGGVVCRVSGQPVEDDGTGEHQALYEQRYESCEYYRAALRERCWLRFHSRPKVTRSQCNHFVTVVSPCSHRMGVIVIP
jgi:hypothetical protein